MKMKKILMLLVAFLATAAFASCGDDDGGSNGGSGGTTVSGLKVTKTSVTFTKDGGSETINVQSSHQVSATSDASWLTVTVGTMSANLKVTPLTLTAAANTDATTDRTATVTVKAGAETEGIVVTQTAGDVLTLEQTEFEVGAAGGTINVPVTTNGEVTVSVDKDWITPGLDHGLHVFTVAPNIGGARTAVITFTLGSLKATATVRQAAGLQGSISATAMDIAKLAYPGWNLGNTLEGINWNNTTTAPLDENYGVATETHWQSTKTTQAVIDYVKSQGFRSVRIPCNWLCGHISNAADHTIDPAWMERVQQIVDYCIGSGLYVLLNEHYDGGWIENSFGDISDAAIQKNSETLKRIWTQIAEAFRDYDEHLMFAGLNEPNCDNQSKTNALLKYEQAFIDAVRATGGNNAKRTLVVQGPSTNIDNTDKWFDVTTLNDPAGAGYLGVEVHYYDPFGFTHCGFGGNMGEDSAKKGDWNWPLYFWGSGNHVTGANADYNSTWGEESYVKSQMERMHQKFVSKGYPVFIGEYGANWRKLDANQSAHDASVKSWFKEVNINAANNGCVTMAWDINSPNQNKAKGTMTIINRSNLTVFCKPAMDGITEGVAAGTWPW